MLPLIWSQLPRAYRPTAAANNMDEHILMNVLTLGVVALLATIFIVVQVTSLTWTPTTYPDDLQSKTLDIHSKYCYHV